MALRQAQWLVLMELCLGLLLLNVIQVVIPPCVVDTVHDVGI